MERGNIIIVNDSGYINGGAAKTAISSAIGLARKGYRVIYFCAVRPIEPKLLEYSIDVVCTGQQEILKDPNRLRAASQGVWNFRAAALLDKVLVGLPSQETVIHLHGWSKALSSSLLPVISRRRVHPIITLHDYFIACPNGGLYNYRTQKCCALKPLSWQCLRTNCDARNMAHKIWRVARQFIQKRVGGMPQDLINFITVSEYSHSVLQPYLPKSARIFHVPNPVDLPQHPAVKVSANDEFFMVGRLSREKGCLLFAEASKKVGCKTVVVGDGEIREQILNINPQMHITGWQSPPEVQQWLSRARVLIFPSQCHETQGLAVLEAAAKGVPAIVSDDCAARDLVVHGETGLLFRKGDVSDLAEKISMMQDSKLAEHLGEKAYERYWANPSTIDNHISELVRIYNS